MKIDIFSHILPPKYKESLFKVLPIQQMKDFQNAIPSLYDLDYRFRIMDKFDDMMQVITPTMPPMEYIKDKQKSIDLSKQANDEMAELVIKYPDRFAAAVACLPLSDIDASLEEIDRAIKYLKCRGVEIYTPINDKPLDLPEFMPLYGKMCQYNLPIWLHPQRLPDYPDYRSEKTSRYVLYGTIGWPYETSAAMLRLVLSGTMERYPELKIITHHAGAMIPFLEKRISGYTSSHDILLKEHHLDNLRKPVNDYLKMFYADTAIYGHTPGLMCSYAYFGASHLLFGTDMPYDCQHGLQFTRDTIDSIDTMAIDNIEKKMIYEENARNLLRLAI